MDKASKRIERAEPECILATAKKLGVDPILIARFEKDPGTYLTAMLCEIGLKIEHGESQGYDANGSPTED